MIDVKNWHGWVGSKERLLGQLFLALPKTTRRFIVPFYGSGVDSVYAILNGWGDSYLLGDDCARVVRGHGALIGADIDALVTDWNAFAALSFEEQKQRYAIERMPYGSNANVNTHPALNLGILSSMAWCCVYRENRKGEHNAPPLKRMPQAAHMSLLQYQQALTKPNVKLICSDFEWIIAHAQTGDVVYCDPPYVDTFSYGRKFNDTTHCRLVRCMREASKRGAHVFATGSDTKRTLELYQPKDSKPLRNFDGINSKGKRRKVIHELLMSY
jgi:DNA adenine methylase